MPLCRALQGGVTGRTEGLSYLQELVVYGPLPKQEVGVKLTTEAHCVVLVFLVVRVVQAGES